MLVVFDFDGVIVDSLVQNMEAVYAAAGMFGSFNKISNEDISKIEDMTFANTGRLLGIDESKIPEFAEKVFELIVADSQDYEVFAGIPELIRLLSTQHTIVINTSNIKAKVDRVLEKNDLKANIFATIDGTDPAPKSDKLIGISKQLGIELKQTIMIGDTTSDVRHGKAAGVQTIAVTWGFQSLETLERAFPDYVAKTPGDILHYLQERHDGSAAISS